MGDAGEAVKAWIEKVLETNEDDNPVLKGRFEGSRRTYKQTMEEHHGRYPFELLQNAHDACGEAGNRSGRAWFAWTDAALLVADSGRGIGREGVEALTSWGTTVKAGDLTAIGHKGVGFVACYELTDTPQFLNSHGTHFGFDLEEAAQRGLPPSYLPQFLDLGDAGPDEGKCQELFDSGAATIVRLPYKEGHGRGESRMLFDEVLDPETLLFMPNLGRISIWDGDDSVEWSCKHTKRKAKFAKRASAACKSLEVLSVSNGTERRDWLVASKSIRATDEDRNSEGWEGIEELGASVAIPWHHKEERLRSEWPRKVCAYYSTEEDTGCGIIFHGDFKTTHTRKGIAAASPTTAVEGMLVEVSAALAADIATLGPKEVNALLHLLGIGSASAGYGNQLRSAVLGGIGSVPILKMHGKGELSAPNEARGASNCTQGNELLQLIGLLGDPTLYMDHGPLPPDAFGVLKELGTKFDDPAELASKVTPKGQAFNHVLKVLKDFADTLARPTPVLAALQDRPVVLTTEREWVAPNEAYLAADLPEATSTLLDFHIAAKAPNPLQAFLEESLEVRQVSTLVAMEQMAKLLTDGVNHGVLLSALRALYDHDHEEFKEFFEHASGNEFDRLEVPTRSQDGSEGTRRLGYGVYFSSDLLESDLLERLYGRFGQEEFLKVAPEETKAGIKRQVEFFELLGVAKDPRLSNTKTFQKVPLGQGRGSKGWTFITDLLDEAKASLHPTGMHPRSRWEWLVHWFDRLPVLLDDPQLESSLAAVELFCYHHRKIPSDRVTCTAQRDCDKNYRPTLGFLGRVVEDAEWVPHEDEFLRPRDVWTNLPTKPQLRLPRAPKGLESVPWANPADCEDPKPKELHVALKRLQRDSTGGVAEDVARTSDWILERMTRLNRRGDALSVPFRGEGIVAHRSGRRVWAPQEPTTRMLAWDLPGFEDIRGAIDQAVAYVPDVDLTPLAKRNGGLNSLELASEHLHVEAKFESEYEATPLLDDLLLAALIELVPEEIRGYLTRALAVLEWRCGNGLRLSYADPQGPRVGSEIPTVAFLDVEQGPAFMAAKVGPGLPDDAKPSRAILYYDQSAKEIEQLDELGPELLRLLPIWARSDAQKDFELLCKTPANPGKLRRTFEMLTEGRIDEVRGRLDLARGHSTEPAIHLEEDGVEPVADPEDAEIEERPNAASQSPNDVASSEVEGHGGDTEVAPNSTGDGAAPPSDGPPPEGRKPDPITYPDPDAQMTPDPNPQQQGRETPRQGTPSRQGTPPRKRAPDDGEGSPSTAERQMESEEASIATIMRLLVDKLDASEVEDVRHLKKGWDLECTIEGQAHFVEAKSRTRQEARIEMSRRERRMLLDKRSLYLVVHVSGTAGPEHHVEVIRDLHEHVGDFDAINYEVPIEVWKGCVDDAERFLQPAKPKQQL